MGGSLTFEVLLIVLLVLANGVFAMSEIAVVSARKELLRQRAEGGDAGARRALELAQHPNHFLSTVQVGITLVGIFAGAYGGATLAGQLAAALEPVPWLAPYRGQVALVLVVMAITYLSLVLGELVPKRIALTHAERIAARVAGPMHTISRLASPLVRLLSASTEGLVRLLRIGRTTEPPVTEEEISALLRLGTEAGVFEEQEQDLVERVFQLGDLHVAHLMTPRRDLVWIDVNDAPQRQREVMAHHRFMRYLVCDGEIDQVVGMVEVKVLWPRALAGEPYDLESALTQPHFVPGTLRALRLLETFRQSGTHLAVVVDEYGGVEGIVTLNDVLEEIAGHLEGREGEGAVQREDGSWLLDGALPFADVRDLLELDDRHFERAPRYNTLAGLVMAELGQIPATGESCTAFGWRFEVVDMDERRVDKVLASPLPVPSPATGSGLPAAAED